MIAEDAVEILTEYGGTQDEIPEYPPETVIRDVCV